MLQNHALGELCLLFNDTREFSGSIQTLAFVSTKVPVSMRQKAGAVDVPKRGTNSSGFTAAK